MSMLKYVEGARPGKPIKRPISDGDKKEKGRAAEAKRKRSFQPEWSTERPWLIYDRETDTMACTWCREGANTPALKEASFVKGCTRMKLEYVKDHECTKLHRRKAAQNRPMPATETTDAGRCLTKLKESEYGQLENKFRTAHFVAKHNLSFRMYVNICKLDQAKGLEIGSAYINDKGAADIVSSIAKVTMQPVVDTLKSAHFFSFTCDGSSDFTGEDMETIYVRTSVKGTVSDQFFNIGSAESASSADIHTYIKGAFTAADLLDDFNRKLVGFCADGASNMQGLKSGLAALLKEGRPHLVVIHCLAHRLELAFKDTIKKSKLYEKAMTLLLGLYYLYRKSPKCKAGLKRSFEAVGKQQVLPTRVGGTRWLPHLQRALNAFFKGYTALRHHLSSASHENAKAEGLYKIASNGHLIVFLMSLREVIYPLVSLSKSLQKTNLTLADAFSHVSASRTILANITTEEHESIQEVINSGKLDGEDVLMFGNPPVDGVKQLADSMINHIDSRLPSTGIISCTQITNFKSWPDSESDLTGFGKDSIRMIADHFSEVLTSAGVDVNNLVRQWQQFKALVYERYADKLRNGQLDWAFLHRSLSDDGVEDCLLTADLLQSLPPTSVRNECAFSVMKLAKNKRRGRMATATLNNLLTVNQLSEPVNSYSPKAAIEHFLTRPNGMRPRRVGGYQKKESTPTPSSSSTILVESDEEFAENTAEPIEGTGISAKDLSDESDDDDEEDFSEKDIDRLIFFYGRE